MDKIQQAINWENIKEVLKDVYNAGHSAGYSEGCNVYEKIDLGEHNSEQDILEAQTKLKSFFQSSTKMDKIQQAIDFCNGNIAELVGYRDEPENTARAIYIKIRDKLLSLQSSDKQVISDEEIEAMAENHFPHKYKLITEGIMQKVSVNQLFI